MSILQTFQSVWAIISSFVILISGVINGGVITSSPNAELVRAEQFTLDEALLMSQGITTDGEYFYTAGSIAALELVGMAKWTADGFEKVIYTHKNSKGRSVFLLPLLFFVLY